MSRDRLLLLEAGFDDPKFPGDRFVCPHGLPIVGLLASAPEQANRLDVEYIGFQRPRQRVIELLDAEHQGLPVLLLGDELPVPADAKTLGSTHYVDDSRRILELLTERHGFPKVH
ncbi:MAG TPA: DUF3088 domain-containing protein [Burkholderiaceae bacterium]|nr:DUF3088 domain-containing protein [Burkholderiaceae bacterium]